EQLRALARKQGATLFMTLLAAFQVLLSRYSSGEDVVVGTAVANRTRRETEELIGFFVNALALRTDLSGDPRFRELLGRVREVCLGAYAHQDAPFEALVEELRPERSLSHSPLFQVAFGLDNTPSKELELPDRRLPAVEAEEEAARFDLTLWVVEREDGGMSGKRTYRTELFDVETVRRMTGRWQALLRSITATPDARLSAIEMLTEAEKKQRDLDDRAREEAVAGRLLTARRRAVTMGGGMDYGEAHDGARPSAPGTVDEGILLQHQD